MEPEEHEHELPDDAPDFSPRQMARMIKALWSTCSALIAVLLGLGYWCHAIEHQATSDRAMFMRKIEETQIALIRVDRDLITARADLVTTTAQLDSLRNELRSTQHVYAKRITALRHRVTALEQLADSLARNASAQ